MMCDVLCVQVAQGLKGQAFFTGSKFYNKKSSNAATRGQAVVSCVCSMHSRTWNEPQ
jgi:DNA polymerase/3'-5' exonuclease PolX